jgi:hypothetical protein
MTDSATSSNSANSLQHQNSHDPAMNDAMNQLASASEQYLKTEMNPSRNPSSFVDIDADFASGSAFATTAENSNDAPPIVRTTVPSSSSIMPHPTSSPIAASHNNGSFHDINSFITSTESNGPGDDLQLMNGMSYEYHSPSDIRSGAAAKKKRKSANSTKQHQLPMFLTKTYHMIEKCDQDVATWSANGDNFVVKHVEKFASSVLPQYFKHSNFSSFARQLNFYGFRKLKAEPILTADYDARTASYVRFYHEKFQKDKPELLVHIKRATKSDVQSKDDVESMRAEVQHLNDVIAGMQNEFDKRLADMYLDLNMKVQNLYQMMNGQMMNGAAPPGPPTRTSYPAPLPPVVSRSLSQKKGTDMMKMLSQASMTLKSPALPPEEANGYKVEDGFTLK